MTNRRVLALYCSVVWIIILGHIIKNIQLTNPFKHRTLSRALYKSPWSYHYTDQPCQDHIYDNEFRGFSKLQSEFWNSLNSSTIEAAKHEWKAFVDNFEYPSQTFSGRGIIYSAFPEAIPRIYASIKLLRKFGCKLPIQVWHNRELKEDAITILETLPGVVTRDIQDYLTKDVSFEIGSKMYSMKGACMMATELDQVMFIDADNIPARDPTFLFETPAFKETGALFWKDFWKTRPDNHIFDLLEIECKDEYEQESGQIVIQKTFPGVYKALSLAYYFQSKPELYFKLLLGDKDTFRYAWRALNFSYHLVRPNLGVLGSLENNQVCGSSMVQFSPIWGGEQYGAPPSPSIIDTQPLVTFIHMNMQKERQELTNFDILQTFNPPIQPRGVGEIYWGHNHACTKLLPPINNPTEEDQPQQQMGLVNSDFKQMFPSLANDFAQYFKEILVVEELIPSE